MRAAIYARVSAMPADEVKDSVPQQVRDGLATARRQGWELAAEPFVDHAISAWDGGPRNRGRVKDRPAWNAILELANRNELDVVVVRHVDRLLRNPQARADVRAAGLAIADHSGHVLDDFAVGILAEVATKESDLRSDRQLRAEDRRLDAGKPPRGGHRQFGYHSGTPASCGCEPADPALCVRHAVREDEAEILREIANRWLAGEPMRALARELSERQVPTVRGGQWSRTGLRKTLLSPRLAGLRVHHRDGEERVVRLQDWTPIFDADLRARLVTAAASGHSANVRAPERYPLTGRLVCGREGCGATLNGKRHAQGRRRYQCLACQRNGIGADAVDAAVWNQALARTWSAEQLGAEELREQLAAAEREVRELTARRERLDDAWADGQLDEARWARQVQRVTRQLEPARVRADELRHRVSATANRWTDLRALAAKHQDATPAERARIVRAAVTRVELLSNQGRAGGRVDLGRLVVTWADGTLQHGLPEPTDVPVWEPAG